MLEETQDISQKDALIVLIGKEIVWMMNIVNIPSQLFVNKIWII
jgi:hypothetical protein